MENFKGKIESLIWQHHNILYMIIKLEKKMNLEIGRFIKLNYKGVERSYTVCNFGNTDVLELFIKMKEGGEMSQKFEISEVGDEVSVTGPFKEADFSGKKIIGIGGGSGMAAFISLIRDAEKKKDRDVVMFVSSKKLVEVGFLGELQKLKHSKAIITLTKEKSEGCESGRITKEMIIRHIDPKDYQIFICGPKSFTVAIGEILKEYKPHLMMW
ncbi:MAG: hypothetical protein GOV01_03680 [Candidatus Altiarchaeota archaeon]|nr:hypothetical protein [Candidatus Altiarchaeota archaeon]